ncbi:FUSC family protein [Danxiaibacter flavus]|uniref:FUSC family protein n=1 Tax=Danxiaibacter flavus TaxID=3049108 RepID=A0ABV3ZI58_9BACT|nr:FUSC family protein [Chitinophagaceae bacterium DXS]
MAGKSSEKATALMHAWQLSFDHILAIRFAINVALATWIVWGSLRLINDTNPIWAIASMVAASDPQPVEARRMFKARLVNVAVGCAVGLAFLVFGKAQQWMLPVALAVTVLISSFVIRIKTMWRQAPITAAVVIASAINHESAKTGLSYGLHKVAEVVFGCLVGLLVSWMMSKLWLIQSMPEPQSSSQKK